MRGASALQEVLAERPSAKLKLLVVWLPVLTSDIAPPTKGVLARLKDVRATQFWDEKRLASQAIRRAVEEDPKWAKPEDQDLCWGQGVVWDFVAVFPEGARWGDRIPRPDFYGYPVVDSIEGLEKRLDDVGLSPTRERVGAPDGAASHVLPGMRARAASPPSRRTQPARSASGAYSRLADE